MEFSYLMRCEDGVFPIRSLPRFSPATRVMENGAGPEGRDPSGFLSEIIGAPVTVKLNSGVVYKGTASKPIRASCTADGIW